MDKAEQALLLQAFREEHPQYFGALPEITIDNVLQVSTSIADNDSMFNDFLGFFNKVSEQYFNSPTFKNPLSENKRATVGYGNTIEEVFIGLVEENLFKGPEADSIRDLFSEAPANISVAYHKPNRFGKYKVTIPETEIKRAMITPGGLGEISQRIIGTMSTSNERDEYVYMKSLIDGAYKSGQLHLVEVGDVDNSAEARERFVQKAREYAGLSEFLNRYNALGVENSSQLGNMTHYVPVKTASIVDTQVLSKAFNLGRTDFIGRQVTVDKFADDNLVGAFVDNSFFVVEDKEYTTKHQEDASKLRTNFWLHVHQIISRSPFATAVAFVKEIPEELIGKVVIDKPLGVIGHYDVEDGAINVEVGFEAFKGETPEYTVEAEVTTGNAKKTVSGKTVKIEPNENSKAGEPVNVKFTVKYGGGGDDDPIELSTIGHYSISQYYQSV